MDVYFLICQNEDYGLTYKGIPFAAQRVIECIPTTLEECPKLYKEYYAQLPRGFGYEEKLSMRILSRDGFTVELEEPDDEYGDRIMNKDTIAVINGEYKGDDIDTAGVTDMLHWVSCHNELSEIQKNA